MSKVIILVVSAVLVLSGSSAFAINYSSSQGYGASGPSMGMSPLDMNKDKIEKIMQALFEIGLLNKMLAQPSMVAVDNGNAIIVAYGNTLRKYDKDLNIVSEVDLDVNLDSMQKLASKLAKKYSGEFTDMMGEANGNLMQAKMTSNDALAKATLRAMSTAAESYATSHNGNYPDNMAALTGATPPYLNMDYCSKSPIAGYTYDCTGMSSAGYAFTATPVTGGTSGSATETIITGGVLTP